MPFTPAEIKKHALEEDAFGHEMRVGAVLNRIALWLQVEGAGRPQDCSKMEIEQGGTYTDVITGKPRQFDFRCRVHHRESDYTVCLNLAVECKNLNGSSPLVICGRPRTEHESYYCFIESAYNPTNTLSGIMKANTQQMYRAGEFVGKDWFRPNLKKSGNEELDLYNRFAQALASSVEMTERACRLGTPDDKRYRSLVLPIVVVPNNTLWIVAYDINGAICQDPEQVDQCEFFVERRVLLERRKQNFAWTHIHFVTLKGLNDFIRGFWASSRTWDRLFPANSNGFQ